MLAWYTEPVNDAIELHFNEVWFILVIPKHYSTRTRITSYTEIHQISRKLSPTRNLWRALLRPHYCDNVVYSSRHVASCKRDTKNHRYQDIGYRLDNVTTATRVTQPSDTHSRSIRVYLLEVFFSNVSRIPRFHNLNVNSSRMNTNDFLLTSNWYRK